MRYTRYNYKPPKKNNNFMIVIILTLIAAIALGTIFSKWLPKNTGDTATEDKTTIGLEKDSQQDKPSLDVSNVITETSTKDYVALQCGVFSKQENALVLKNSLMPLGTPFIIEEDNLNRVLLGIYPKEDIDSITKQLNESKIDYVKINFAVSAKDPTSALINEMISADIKILNKLSEKDTKSIQTSELKKWLGSLEGAEEKSENYTTMEEIKTYLSDLPEELKKEKTEEGYIYIYKFMKKLLKI